MSDHSSTIEELKAQEAELERLLNEVRTCRVGLERKTSPAERRPSRALREVILDLLQEAGCPLNSLLLASVIRPLLGRIVPSTRFGTLSNDEAVSFDSSRARPVYLCHCLTFDQGAAVKRFWARSDWPLAERVMGPMTGRILFLKGATWTIGLAQMVQAQHLAAENAEKLQFIAADQARDAGLTVTRGEFPYGDWLAAITSMLARHEAEDRELREAAAAELGSQLSDRDQLFGARGGLVSLPGSRASWRSSIDER